MKSIRSYSFLLLVIFQSCTTDEPEQKFDIEWLYSDEGRSVGAVYKTAWIDEDKLYLMDMRKPKEDRTLLQMTPKNSSDITSIIDPKKISKNILNAVGRSDTMMYIEWPSSFSSNGEHGLYLFEDDIYLLDIQNQNYRRITDTESEEKAARFSPDGKKISFVRDNDIYVYDLRTKREKRITFNGSETNLNGTLSWVYWEEIFGRQNIGYWWSDDSKALAFLNTDESQVTKMHYVHWKPAEPELITQRYPKAGTKNPEVKLGIIELENLKLKWVDLGPYEYLCRVKWLPGSERLSVQTMNRAQTELDLFFVDRYSGKNVKKILTESDTGWVNITDDLYFLDESFIWQSERNGFAHLYQFSYDGKLLSQITDGNWALRSSGGTFWMRQSVVSIDEENKKVYYTAMKESSIERHLYSSSFDGRSLEKISGPSGVHKIYFNDPGSMYLDIYSDSDSPPTLVIHNKQGGVLHTLVDERPEIISDYNLQTPELFTIPTSDGFMMPAQILKPKGFNPSKKYPVIFHVYGGPSAPTVFDRWQGNSLFFDNMLLQQGYLIVKFDHRASTAISKKLENHVLNAMSGPIERKDIVDGIKWLKSQSYTDANRFGVWGWSGGGSFTLNMMTNTEEFKAGVSVAPVTDWHYYDTKWTEFAMKRPVDNPDGYEKTSFIKTAKNLHGSLLLVHGTYDDNVHPQNSWHFIDELVKENIQFDMMFYPMRKHGIADDEARIHLYTKMLNFWKLNL
ncbi:MAG: S9 family peptidase [Candidatus Neomarinimicrobiota bacterium]